MQIMLPLPRTDYRRYVQRYGRGAVVLSSSVSAQALPPLHPSTAQPFAPYSALGTCGEGFEREEGEEGCSGTCGEDGP